MELQDPRCLPVIGHLTFAIRDLPAELPAEPGGSVELPEGKKQPLVTVCTFGPGLQVFRCVKSNLSPGSYVSFLNFLMLA